MLGNSDLKYKAIADQLANEIMQCSIDYFNEKQKNKFTKEDIKTAQDLIKLAENIAVGKLTKDRAKENLNTLEAIKFREINNAIALLSSIKDAYEEAVRTIDKEVERARMSLSPWESINYSKVEELKRNCLNWDKIAELIKSEITSDDIEAIKNCPDEDKIAQYKDLVTFLFSKLPSNEKSKLRYLKYWETEPNTYKKTMHEPTYDTLHPKNPTKLFPQQTMPNYQKVEEKDKPKEKNENKNDDGCLIAIVVFLIILGVVYYIWGWKGVAIAMSIVGSYFASMTKR